MALNIPSLQQLATPVSSARRADIERRQARMMGQEEEMNALQLEAMRNPAPDPKVIDAFMNDARSIAGQMIAYEDALSEREDLSDDERDALLQRRFGTFHKMVSDKYSGQIAEAFDEDARYDSEGMRAWLGQVEDQDSKMVQSSFTTEDGNLGYLTRGGEPVVTAIKVAGPSTQSEWIDLPDGRRVFGRTDPRTGAVFGPSNELLFAPIRGESSQGQQSDSGAESAAGMARAPEEERRAILEAEQDVERIKNEPDRIEKVRLLRTNIESLDETISEAIANVGASTAGWGAIFAAAPGSRARTLANDIQTIQARLSFDTIQQMRDASPTGGALGQVSERELNLLQSALQTLDQYENPEDLRRRLEKVQRHYMNWLEAVEEADQRARAQAAGDPRQMTDEQILEALQ